MPFIELSQGIINTDDIERIRLLKWKYKTPAYILKIALKTGGYIEYEYYSSCDRNKDYQLLASVLIGEN